jgi:PAS domain S-box-containing protein
MAANPSSKPHADAGLPLAGVLRHNRIVGRAALLLAIAIAIAGPVLFATLGTLDFLDLRRFQAALTAEQVARYAYTQGPTWRFSDARVAELVRPIAPADPGRRLIAPIEGGDPIVVGEAPASPVARVEAPIVAGAQHVGTVMVEASLRPLIADAGLAVVVSLLLAAAAYACVRIPSAGLGRAVGALRQSEARFHSLAAAAPMAITMSDLDGRVQWANREALNRAGLTAEDLKGRSAADLHSPGIAAEIARLDLLAATERAPQTAEFEIGPADGPVRHELHVRFPIEDHRGAIVGVGSAALDISAQRAAEGQLREALRMQVVGQLSGGVSHDFNNILQVVETSLTLARIEIGNPARATALIEDAQRAGRRGAELTEKLLAFSRQQVLTPHRIEARAWLAGETRLLSRTLSEGILVRTRYAVEAAWISADEGSLASALLNLALNARAAMPDGGTLTFALGRRRLDAPGPDGLPAGDYVEISVIDTGTGMPREVANRAFEPFFTTREVGQGSGLGLSMVYGFARQSGGTAVIDSTVGKGTTVGILLPAAEPGDEAKEAAPAAEPARPRPDGEIRARVLLVEDDADVRAATRRLLEALGCEVVEAEGAVPALGIIEADPAIGILISDVILPGEKGGTALAKEASVKRPGLKTILISGYPERSFKNAGNPDIPFPLLRKPFSGADLAKALTAALGPTPPGFPPARE